MKADLRRTLQAIIDDPDTMDVVCSHVASGASLVSLCEVWGVPFGSVTNWIRKDPTRAARYNAAITDRGEYTVETVLHELRRLGVSDIRALFRDDGSLLPVTDWPEDAARAVASIKVDELFEGTGRERRQVGWTKQVKFWDKTKALELMGKHMALFIDRKETKLTVTLEDLVRGSLDVTPATPVTSPATETPKDVTPLSLPPPNSELSKEQGVTPVTESPL